MTALYKHSLSGCKQYKISTDKRSSWQRIISDATSSMVEAADRANPLHIFPILTSFVKVADLTKENRSCY